MSLKILTEGMFVSIVGVPHARFPKKLPAAALTMLDHHWEPGKKVRIFISFKRL